MDIQSLTIYVGAAAVLLLLLFIAILVARSMRGGIKGRRGQRLEIVEYHDLDPSRRLVLVRRDRVEHLLLVGSHQDLVVEAGIPAAGLGPEMSHDAPFLRRAPRMEPPPQPVSPPPEPRPQPGRMAPRPAAFSDRVSSVRAFEPDHPRIVPVRDRYDDGTDGSH